MKKTNIDQSLLLEEQIKASINNYFNNFIAIFFVSLTWYFVLLKYNAINEIYVNLWLSIQSMIAFSFCFLYLLYHNNYQKIKHYWKWKIEFPLTCISGFTWGMGWFLFIDPNDLSNGFFLNALICGTTMGYAMGTPLDQETTYAGMFFCLIPVVIKCFLIGNNVFFWFGITILIFLISSCLFSTIVRSIYINMLIQREENAQLAKALEIEKQHVEKINKEKTRFLAAASHDLRQPIQAMKLFESVLSSKLNNPQQHEILDKISKANQNLSNLLDSLLDISKLDSGLIDINPQIIYIDDIFYGIHQQYSLLAREKQIDLRCVVTNLQGFIDPYQLERILNNLVTNAIKYMGRPGKILLGIRRKKNSFLIEVWDNGEGIPDLEQEKIFDEFYQINNPERNRTKGLGLGLAIVSRLTTLIGSQLSFKSNYGKGCYFALSFPFVESLSIENTLSNNIIPENTNFIDANKYLILVIEDDMLLAEALTTLLNSWGFKTQQATHISEALQCLENGCPNFILSDYQLQKGETGLEAIKIVRKKTQQCIPALLLTGDTRPETLNLLNQQTIPFLHKPIQFEQLKHQIKQLLPKLN